MEAKKMALASWDAFCEKTRGKSRKRMRGSFIQLRAKNSQENDDCREEKKDSIPRLKFNVSDKTRRTLWRRKMWLIFSAITAKRRKGRSPWWNQWLRKTYILNRTNNISWLNAKEKYLVGFFLHLDSYCLNRTVAEWLILDLKNLIWQNKNKESLG